MVYAYGLLRMPSSLYGVATAHLPGQKPGQTYTALRGWKLPASAISVIVRLFLLCPSCPPEPFCSRRGVL